MPVLARVITLLAARIPAAGVKRAVQVMPPSLLLTALRVPWATFRSLLSKPLTASENVTVTKEVSPALNTGSAITMVAVGRWLSMA